MAKKIFISFAIEDVKLRDLLVGQAKNENSPFDFIDMSVKEPWSSDWKTKCRTKIKGCDGMIVIATKNTKKATGQLWEIDCAKEEKIPCRGIQGYTDDNSSLEGVSSVKWTWENISNWLNKL